ncbi:MAG: Crp/Fnr family transcriptional regulator [Campylobacteraceae bacterium]|nr:Crp/Fnr family transcriptional regulator [Campylobacteraceae bacterium]
MKTTETIKSIAFFNELNEDQIILLSSIANMQSYPKKSILNYESDETTNILFLITGLIKIYKVDKFNNEIFLYHIHERNMISELSSLRSNTIYCFSNSEFIEDSVVLSINFKKFNELFLSQNILTMKFMEEILDKSHQLQGIVNRELVFDATAKVAYMLNNDIDMFNKLKRQEVSFMLHIQPETLSRVLKRLKRNNIIDIISSKITILDKDQLSSTFTGIGL